MFAHIQRREDRRSTRKCMRRHNVWAFDWCFHFYCYDSRSRTSNICRCRWWLCACVPHIFYDRRFFLLNENDLAFIPYKYNFWTLIWMVCVRCEPSVLRLPHTPPQLLWRRIERESGFSFRRFILKCLIPTVDRAIHNDKWNWYTSWQKKINEFFIPSSF